MIKRFLAVAGFAAMVSSPLLAANGPVTDRDLQCFVLMATTEFAIRKQVDDPKTPADQRQGLSKALTMLRSKGDWYLARISTLPPEKRTMADFDRARDLNKAMDKDAFNAFFDGCIKGTEEDRVAAVKQLLN